MPIPYGFKARSALIYFVSEAFTLFYEGDSILLSLFEQIKRLLFIVFHISVEL